MSGPDIVQVSSPLNLAAKLGVVTVDAVKAQERITHGREDELIKGYIEAAYDYLSGRDGWLGMCCLLEEEFEAFFPAAAPVLELPMRPVKAAGVVSLSVRNGDGTYEVVASDGYAVVDGKTFTEIHALQPIGQGVRHPRAVSVRFKAGFGTADEIPSGIKKGITLLAADQYQNREETFTDPRIAFVSRRIEMGLRAFCGRHRISPDHS